MENKKIWLSSPHLGKSELGYVHQAFDSNWIAPLGPNVDLFENAISDFLSANRHKLQTAALVSGTAAIHLALRILGIQSGDIVFVQSFTFCGTTSPVSYQSAEIVFIDSEPDTWNMCPISLKKALLDYHGKSVRAIIPVHLYGMPAKMDRILALAEEFSVPVIEDAAEALGSHFREQRCGTFGLMSALSFNGNKIITTSGGGALVSANREYIDKARFFATQARDEAIHYQHSQLGYNYRMSNILAGIGCGQMEVLVERVNARRANNMLYRNYFSQIQGVSLQTEPSRDYFSNFWLTTILVDPALTGGVTRETIRLALQAQNIESRPLWKPMHLQPMYSGSKFYGDGFCEYLFDHGLCLPSGSNLEESDFERIFSVLDSIFR
jgi:dTDP-4-amino-4,6-dideoxygalactose transaminase